MASVEPVTPSTAAAATDPGSQTDDSQVQQAFATGVLNFMGVMLQSAESDVVSAINDDTSDPDAPS